MPPEQTNDDMCPSLSAPVGHEGGNAPDVSGQEGWELVFRGQDATHGLSVAPQLLTFCKAEDVQEISVTNHLPIKVVTAIDLPSQTGSQQQRGTCAWQVRPETAELEPGTSTSFRVVFLPVAPGQYSTQTVSIVAYAKYMRSFRLCNEVRAKSSRECKAASSHKSIQLHQSCPCDDACLKLHDL
jgi:hypothetical protein